MDWESKVLPDLFVHHDQPLAFGISTDGDDPVIFNVLTGKTVNRSNTQLKERLYSPIVFRNGEEIFAVVGAQENFIHVFQIYGPVHQFF